MEIPTYFVDEMMKSSFKWFKHEHSFTEKNGVTVMIDFLQYETSLGIFGKLFDRYFLEKHMRSFLLERNRVLKEMAEK